MRRHFRFFIFTILDETQQRQVDNKKHIQALRDELKSTEVTKVAARNESSRAKLEKELGRLINAYKRCDEDLKTKEAKLDAYKEALEAAHDELIAYQNERREQEIELARLEASVAQMRVEEIKTSLPFDRSKLAQIKKNTEGLRNKVQVRQKELELQGRYIGKNRPAAAPTTTPPARDVMAEADALLGLGEPKTAENR